MASFMQHMDGMHGSEDTHDPPASSVPATLPPSRMTFQVVARHLPLELLLTILREWIGSQSVTVDSSSHPNYKLSYINPDHTLLNMTSRNAPLCLLGAYLRLKIHSWLTDTKDFSDPSTFYLSHLLTSLKMPSRLAPYTVPAAPCWNTLIQTHNLTLTPTFPILQNDAAQYASFPHLTSKHGFEKIKLDFTAEQYFALFDVCVPPFHYRDDTVTGDNLYRDDYCHSAGAFLAHTKSLELHFGDAYRSTNPWYNIQEPAWCEINTKWAYQEARLRPHVCESGKVVDWILGYAWYAGYLQHIPEIRISGDVQDWVKRKWRDIFRRHKEVVDARPGEWVDVFEVHRPDVVEIETIGMVDDEEEEEEEDEDRDVDRDGEDDDDEEMMDEDEAWMPRNHYSLPCTCEIGCWRLRGGIVEEDLPVKTWDDYEQYSEVAQGDWNDVE